MVPAVALAALACGSHFKPESYPTPQSLLAASKQQYDAGNCGGAMNGFRRVTLELPQNDPGVIESHYYIGLCYEQEGDHLEAAREFRRVSDDYPTSDLAPKALLKAGESQAKMWRAPDLDPTYGEAARSTFQEVIQRFGQSPSADSARDHLARLQDDFAKKTLENGEFYFRLHAYDSAIIYFRSVVADYPNSKIVPEALVKLVDTYRKINYNEEARQTCAHLRRFFPGADGVNDVCPAADTSTS